MQRLTLLLVVLVAQAGVGYAQYLNDIPPLLVGIHIAGATAVWTATVWALPGHVRAHAPPRAGPTAADGVATTRSLARA